MQQENTRQQLLNSSGGIFVIRALPAAAFLISAIMLSRLLPTADYGAYQALWSRISLFSSLACIGLPSLFVTIPAAAALRFIPQNGFVKKSIAAAITLAAILLWIFGNTIASPVSGFIIVGSITLSAIIEALLLQTQKIKPLLILNAVYAIMFVLLHVALAKGFIGFRLLFTGISMLSLLKLATSLRLISGAQLAAAQQVESREQKVHFRLWAQLAFYDAIQYFFKWIDKAILALLLPPATFAIYFNGTYDVPFLPLLLGAASSAMLIHLAKRPQKASTQATIQKRASLLMSSIVFPAFFFLAVFRNELFTVIFSQKYAGSASLFLIAILVLPLRTYNFTTLLQHAGKGRTINTGAVLDLIIALALMWPLYRIYGLRGVALAFVISTYVQAIFYLVATKKMLRIPVLKLFPAFPLLIRFIAFGSGYMLLYYRLRPHLAPAAFLLLGTLFTGIVAGIPVMMARFRK